MEPFDPSGDYPTPPAARVPGTRTVEFEDQARIDKMNRPLYPFGIVYQFLDKETVSSVLRDMLCLIGSMPGNQRLQIYSPNSVELMTAFGESIDADYVSGNYQKCTLWKGYYTTKKPEVPEGVVVNTWMQVVPADRPPSPVIRVVDSTTIPVVNGYKTDIMRDVPMGSSPLTKTMPPFTKPNQWSPAIQLFSSVPGDDVQQKVKTAVRELATDAFFKRLPFLAGTYNISKEPEDYFFKTVLMFHTDMPNRNGYAFPLDAMLEWNPERHLMAYETWRYAPLHVEHKDEDPTQAIGVIADVALKKAFGVCDGMLYKVMALAAVDRTKRSSYTSRIESNEINSWSMGCDAYRIYCTYCGAEQRVGDAKNPGSGCNHLDINAPLQFYIMNGQVVCRAAYGISGKELSSVGTPAWPMAVSTKRTL